MKNKRYYIGLLAYYVSSFLAWTIRFSIIKHPQYNKEKTYLFAFWHGKQFLPVLKFNTHQTRRAVLVSPSKDGDILAVWLQKLGFEVIRGSSRHRNIAALAAMLRKLKEGFSIGFGVDGPIGPIHQVKPGMTHMAQKLQIEIVPVGSAFSRKWIFHKAWDKYEVPKPFCKGVCFVGAPILIEPDADLEHYNQLLEEKIKEVEAKALAWCQAPDGATGV